VAIFPYSPLSVRKHRCPAESTSTTIVVDRAPGMESISTWSASMRWRSQRPGSSSATTPANRARRPSRAETAATLAADPPRCCEISAGVSEVGSISSRLSRTITSTARSPIHKITGDASSRFHRVTLQCQRKWPISGRHLATLCQETPRKRNVGCWSEDQHPTILPRWA
jgi:hypothetical protein